MPDPVLGAYLKVQQGWEREALYILKRAAAEAEKEIRALAGSKNVSSVMRREQLLLTRRSLLKQQADMWRAIGQTVMAARADAAAAAVDALAARDMELLKRAGLSSADRQTYIRSLEANARRNVDNLVTREMGFSRIPLSEQVYKTRALSNGWIDKLIGEALSQGTSARSLAKAVKAFINPDVPGGASYAAMRLGRTELNNAFHATSIRKMQDTPWVDAVQWNLSGSHPRPDECNEYADSSHFRGGDAGVFKKDQVPAKPHPNCLCFVTPVTVTTKEFVDGLLAGNYDPYLDDVMRKSGYTEEFIASSRFR